MRKDLKLIGAAAERKAIRAYVKRNRINGYVSAFIFLNWLKGRDERYNARKGGLGRTKKPR